MAPCGSWPQQPVARLCGLLRRGTDVIDALVHERGEIIEALIDIIVMLRQRGVLVVNALVHRGVQIIEAVIHVVETFVHVIEAVIHVVETPVHRILLLIKAFIDIETKPGEYRD